MLSVIIPANNEAAYIGPCLDALLASDAETSPVEILVVANACADATVARARARAAAAARRGWRLEVIDLEKGGKLNALNVGDATATGGIRAYLDADVTVSPALIAGIAAALDRPDAAYASGKPEIPRARSWATRAYARIWRRLPFMTDGVPGCGLFAVNAAGRARWGEFPDIIADDVFVRLSFAPHERIGVAAPYQFPLIDGFRRLVRVRRRQNLGVAEVARLYPDLVRNEDKPPLGASGLLRLAAGDPVGFCVYCAVALAVRLPARAPSGWARGR